MTHHDLPPRLSLLLAGIVVSSTLAATPALAQGYPPEAPCRQFIGAPGVDGDILYFEQLGPEKYILIPVRFSDETVSPVSQTFIDQFVADMEYSLRTNSYSRFVVDVESIDAAEAIELDEDYTYYSMTPGQLRVDILEKANTEIASMLPPGETIETYYDREIIFHSQQTKSQGIGQRTIWMKPTASGFAGAHEAGHTFRWDHANFLYDASDLFPEPTFGMSGNEEEYGDRFDIMGDALSFHHFNPWYKVRSGWLDPSAGEVTTVDVSSGGTQTFVLDDLASLPDTASGHYAAIRVPRDPLTDTWIFYRGANGPSSEGEQPGAVLTWGARTNARPSWLLDMTPGSLTGTFVGGNREFPKDLLDADLEPDAEAYVLDDATGIAFKCTSANSTSATVQVIVPSGGVTIDQVPIVQVVTPTPGATVTGVQQYEVTAFDPDCSSTPTNGQGIDYVEFQLVANYDGLVTALRSWGTSSATSIDSIAIRESATDYVPPYTMTVDTAREPDPFTGLPLAIPNRLYDLVVTVVSLDGGMNRVTFPHVIYNE